MEKRHPRSFGILVEEQGSARRTQTLTFLPRTLLHVGVSGYHDYLYHEAVATLPDHVDNLSVTDLHHILPIDLVKTKRLSLLLFIINDLYKSVIRLKYIHLYTFLQAVRR